MLNVDNLSFNYGGVEALRNIGMNMDPGDVTCVLGRNGAGKTTLMRTIMGYLRPCSGHIHVDSQDLTHLAAYKRARAGVALVPQGRRVFPKLTVAQNIRVGLEARGDGCKTIPDEIYDRFPKLRAITRRAAGRLSGGEQQQLAFARAIVSKPRILLLDEPTEGIERKTVDAIGELLRELIAVTSDGAVPMTIVLVEQNLGFVKEYGDTFYVLDRGTVVGNKRPIRELEADMTRHLL